MLGPLRRGLLGGRSAFAEAGPLRHAVRAFRCDLLRGATRRGAIAAAAILAASMRQP
jgi:hypothetical protein